jgi:inhibitor of KinA sporulation pathway (predicted exonuclease)
MNYLSLDLELNTDAEGKTTKIIQVGVAIGSPEYPDDIITHSWYVNPGEPLSPFITQLTGITESMVVDGSTPLSSIAEQLLELVDKYQTFVNPVQWGSGDVAELKGEFAAGNIPFRCFGHRHIDVKTIYSYLETSRGKDAKGGLQSCMSKHKLKFEGQPHRAEVDAFNTLRFYFALLLRQRTLEEAMQSIKTIKY